MNDAICCKTCGYHCDGICDKCHQKLRKQRDELLQLVREYTFACNCWTCDLCRRADAAIAACEEEDARG